MMAVGGLDHVTLVCAPHKLPGVREFYEQVIGLQAGPRPPFDFPGTWLYADKQPIVHLAAVLDPAGVDAMSSSATALPGMASRTGSIDHIALRVNSTVQQCRDRLNAHGVPFTEAPVPDFALHQVFLRDPLGVKIELNFDLTP